MISILLRPRKEATQQQDNCWNAAFYEQPHHVKYIEEEKLKLRLLLLFCNENKKKYFNLKVHMN